VHTLLPSQGIEAATNLLADATHAHRRDEVPGFRTRKVKTNVTVRHGETIVLSGVFSHDEQKAVSKLPGLGHIPIIGELFKSRAFDSTKRELVIFVTPRIVNPDSDKIRTIIEDVKSRYKQARSEVNFNIFD